jgi:hypothetical protein
MILKCKLNTSLMYMYKYYNWKVTGIKQSIERIQSS